MSFIASVLFQAASPKASLTYDPFTQLTTCIRTEMNDFQHPTTLTYNAADERVLKVHENREEQWTQATLYVVKALLANGVDVNATNREGETPLHLAAMYDYIDGVKALVASGANINASTGGKTPLDGASNKEVREFLIRSGAR